jgi:hypothetical protein
MKMANLLPCFKIKNIVFYRTIGFFGGWHTLVFLGLTGD